VTSHHTAVRKEHRVLRALFQPDATSSLRETAQALLKEYQWKEPLHAAIFKILQGWATANSELLRSQFPALLTRRGFPDVAWEEFLQPCDVSLEETTRLVEELRESA